MKEYSTHWFFKLFVVLVFILSCYQFIPDLYGVILYPSDTKTLILGPLMILPVFSVFIYCFFFFMRNKVEVHPQKIRIFFAFTNVSIDSKNIVKFCFNERKLIQIYYSYNGKSKNILLDNFYSDYSSLISSIEIFAKNNSIPFKED